LEKNTIETDSQKVSEEICFEAQTVGFFLEAIQSVLLSLISEIVHMGLIESLKHNL